MLARSEGPPSAAVGEEGAVPRRAKWAATWMMLACAAILLLALAFNLVGDALREEMDPTQKGRG